MSWILKCVAVAVSVAVAVVMAVVMAVVVAVVVAVLMYNDDLKIAIILVAVPIATATATHLKIQIWKSKPDQNMTILLFKMSKHLYGFKCKAPSRKLSPSQNHPYFADYISLAALS